MVFVELLFVDKSIAISFQELNHPAAFDRLTQNINSCPFPIALSGTGSSPARKAMSMFKYLVPHYLFIASLLSCPQVRYLRGC